MIFRDATEADLPTIVALLSDDPLGASRESPDDPAYLAAFQDIAAQTGNTMIVGEDEGAIIACLQLTIIPGLSRSGAKRAQIESVRVAASHRSQGVGARIFDHALDRARAEGCALAQLTTDLTRADAHRFYEQLGFTHTHAGYKRPL